ncbi:membrane bound O-acyl transferase family-domain-containing protein [Hypoxylon fuscum]|nr:membrane bound O-acyl transferase family-domain-containing protein [Hypoxylon fuscum]
MAQHADTGIATAYRGVYSTEFRDQVLAGAKQPFLVPLHLLSVFLLTLYLAIPHKNRPWLYRMRWLVLAIVVAFNFHMIRNVSSHAFASAYAAGLVGAWGIIWNFTLLIWTRPQWDAKRVNIRRKRGQGDTERNRQAEENVTFKTAALEDDSAAQSTNDNHSSCSSTHAEQNIISIKECYREGPNYVQASGLGLNGHTANGSNLASSLKRRQPQNNTKTPAGIPETSSRGSTGVPASIQLDQKHVPSEVDLQKLAADQEFEYYWEEYPANASFWRRLDWAFDIVSALRMTGWNWAIPCLPPYEPPAEIGNLQLPLSSVGPQRTKQGYTRELSYRNFFIARLWEIIPSYLLVDYCAANMTADPYFILGPENEEPLPPHLVSLSPFMLSVQRTALSFLGVVSALQLAFSALALALAFLPPLSQILGFRAHPWHLPSATGSFTQVLDRGLAGFWGAWWHQTFRFLFAAPTKWLIRKGYVKQGTTRARITGAVVAFLQSAFLHASGSYSTVPSGTKWWLPPFFFFLAGVGTMLQSWLSVFFRTYIERMPRWMRRLGNLAFVLVWMLMTSWALVDDFGRCGLWLYEPVPVSVVRWLGYGPSPDRRIWRLERTFGPQLYWGKHWWDIGIAI